MKDRTQLGLLQKSNRKKSVLQWCFYLLSS
jgi:hypothetical protein